MRRKALAHFLLILCSQTPRKAALRGDFSAQFLHDVAFYHLAHLTNKPKQMSRHYHLTNKLRVRVMIRVRVRVRVIIRLLMLNRLTPIVAACRLLAQLTLRLRALLPGNVRSFSGKAKQTQAPLSTLEAPLKHLEANQANQAVNVTVTVNGTGIVNVIDYSLLVQSALPNCERSAQFAPFAQLSLRLCARSCSHKKCARWRVIFTAAAKIRQMSARRNRVIRHLFRV